MPAQVSVSNILRKYGAKLDQAVQKHAGDQTDYGFMKLPPDINGGIAQLFECKFDIFKKGTNEGEAYFQARGMVIEPKSVVYNGMVCPVAGLHTMIQIPVCETKNQAGDVTTVEENVEKILNEMRKLGGPDATKVLKNGAGLEQMAALIKQAKPYFRFSTSLGKESVDPRTGQPRERKVFENWHGSKNLEGYAPPDQQVAGVEDNGAQASGKGRPSATPGKPTRNGVPSRAPQPAQEAPEEESGADASMVDQGDTDTLLERAKAKPADKAAQQELIDMAIRAGYTKEEADGTDTWDQVVEMIRNPKVADEEPVEASEGENEESEATEKADPEEGQTFKFKVPGKDGKGGKVVDCEVVSVSEKNRTVTLKNLVTDQVVMNAATKKPLNVSWDHLED